MPTRKMIERSLTKPNGKIRWFWFVPCVWRVAVWRGTRRYGRVRDIFLHVTFTYEPDQLNCSPKHMHKHKMYWLDFYAGHSESERTVRNTMTYESLHTIQNCVGYARSELRYRRPKSKNMRPTILFMFIWSTCMSFVITIRKYGEKWLIRRSLYSNSHFSDCSGSLGVRFVRMVLDGIRKA